MGQVKKINIKNRTYYFFNDMVNIEVFDPNLLKIDKKSYKNMDIYYIGYMAIKKIDDYENIHSVNPLYLMIGEVDGHIEEKMRVNIQFLILRMKTEKYWRNTQNFGMGSERN